MVDHRGKFRPRSLIRYRTTAPPSSTKRNHTRAKDSHENNKMSTAKNHKRTYSQTISGDDNEIGHSDPENDTQNDVALAVLEAIEKRLLKRKGSSVEQNPVKRCRHLNNSYCISDDLWTTILSFLVRKEIAPLRLLNKITEKIVNGILKPDVDDLINSIRRMQPMCVEYLLTFHRDRINTNNWIVATTVAKLFSEGVKFNRHVRDASKILAMLVADSYDRMEQNKRESSARINYFSPKWAELAIESCKECEQKVLEYLGQEVEKRCSRKMALNTEGVTFFPFYSSSFRCNYLTQEEFESFSVRGKQECLLFVLEGDSSFVWKCELFEKYSSHDLRLIDNPHLVSVICLRARDDRLISSDNKTIFEIVAKLNEWIDELAECPNYPRFII